ncbi:PE domain-containing protein [Glycomyces terrestris]|uniref:PE domain-containing protein n=1 Tax=Glycomyces terrestris TaxID=2493553 RepID=A0A426UXQ0_9ACTN|nr:PE domain-containing protein [Glycomyces terrestris]RRR99318.1 PE domain-containing protein [Glycomyces terrestris]
MSSLHIDPDALDGAGQAMEAVAESFFAAVEGFASSIEGVTEACGADEIGGLIQQAHTEVFEWAKECFQEAAQEIADAGFDVRDFAKQHLDADSAIAQIFTQLNSDLGGGA